MLKIIIQREILENIKNLRLFVAIVLCLLLVTMSIFVMEQDYADSNRASTLRADLDELRIRNSSMYLSLGQRGVKVQKTIPSLRVFSKGINSEKTDMMWFSRYQEPVNLGEIIINPFNELFPLLDYTFIVGTIVTLIVILFSYGAICKEREDGTLKLMLSASVPRHVILLGKWLAGYICILIPFLISLLMGLVMISISPDIHFRGEDWQALGVIIAASVIYIALFFNLGLFISARTRSSSNALIVLLLIWISAVIIVPKVAPYAVSYIYPVASDKEMMMKHVTLMQDVQQRAAQEVMAEARKRGEERPNISQNEWNIKWVSMWNEEFAKVEQETANRLDRQLLLVKSISSISPYCVFDYIVSDLASTGTSAELHLRRKVNEYRPKFVKYIDDRMDYGVTYTGGAVDTSDMPRMTYYPPRMEERLNFVLYLLGILIIENIIFFMAAFMSFMRYDIR
jgi:ABC-type transport system involved in multi-copper enzyme maturation permease subunit